MKKKKSIKSSKKIAKNRRSLPLSNYIIAVIGLLAVILVGKALLHVQNHSVLGTQTLLASKGSGSDSSGSGSSGSDSSDSDDSSKSGSSGSDSSDDSSSSSDSGSSGSGSSGSSTSGSSGSGSGSSSGSYDTAVSGGTTVNCTGPDGKQFETTYSNCENLNKSWGNTNFSFTIISNPTHKSETRTRIRPTSTPEISHVPEVENEDDDAGLRTRTESKQNETRTEVRFSETERIRTRTKDGRTRIDITSGGIKTRLEYRDGRVIVKAEQEDGTEVELADDTIFKIDQRLGTSGIKVATTGAEHFVLERGSAGAITNFPLSIDLATNTLMVNTPAGQKTVTVLPDQAIQNLIAANVVNRLGGQAIIDEELNKNLTSVSQLITLGERNGVPIYEINGISDQKLLGFIPITIEKEIEVSAITGEVVSSQTSLSDKILDFLSF